MGTSKPLFLEGGVAGGDAEVTYEDVGDYCQEAYEGWSGSEDYKCVAFIYNAIGDNGNSGGICGAFKNAE